MFSESSKVDKSPICGAIQYLFLKINITAILAINIGQQFSFEGHGWVAPFKYTNISFEYKERPEPPKRVTPAMVEKFVISYYVTEE